MAHIFCYIQIGTLTLHDGMAVCVSSRYKCQILVGNIRILFSRCWFCPIYLFFLLYSAAPFDLSIIGCLLCKVNYFDWILHMCLLFWFEKITQHGITLLFDSKMNEVFEAVQENLLRIFHELSEFVVFVGVVTDDDVTETWFNSNRNWHL